MQHPTAPVTHILYCHPSTQSAAMQPLFHLTLKSTKLEQDLQMCKTNIRLVQPVLITSCGKTRRTFSLFQGYPVRRQGQHDWRVGRRTGGRGSTGLRATLTLNLSVAKRQYRTRRCQTKAYFVGGCPWKWEKQSCITYCMTQFLKREREREWDKERTLGRESNFRLLDCVPAVCCCLRLLGTTSSGPIH